MIRELQGNTFPRQTNCVYKEIKKDFLNLVQLLIPFFFILTRFILLVIQYSSRALSNTTRIF